jgi:ribosomal protein L40E
MKRMDSRFRKQARVGAHCRDCGAYVPGQVGGCDACGSNNLSHLVRGEKLERKAFAEAPAKSTREYLEAAEVAAVLGKVVGQ